MATLSKEELIDEIDSICNFMVNDKPVGKEYVQEILQGKDLEDCSVALLYQKRKLAQIYLSDYCIIKKSFIDDEIKEIDKAVDHNRRIKDLKKEVELLNKGDFHKITYSNHHKIRDLRDGMEYITDLIEEKQLGGTIKLECDLKVTGKPLKANLEQKIELIKELRSCDRILQQHMRKKAPCTVPDSNYAIRIKKIQEDIAEIEAEQ